MVSGAQIVCGESDEGFKVQGPFLMGTKKSLNKPLKKIVNISSTEDVMW